VPLIVILQARFKHQFFVLKNHLKNQNLILDKLLSFRYSFFVFFLNRNMFIGYARVSKNEQNLDLQIYSLIRAGCSEKNIFTDKITGTKAARAGLEEALNQLRSSDTFVVWRLDRLGRSLKHLIETVTKLKEQDIAFLSIAENIDTSTATGQLVFHIFGTPV
jgi:DNA invertase Pin-like site-specific DNA recombinase